jgi:biopolymer transport protein ExbB/TolQ
MTGIGILVAIAAIMGYTTIRDEARKVATQAAVDQVNELLKDVISERVTEDAEHVEAKPKKSSEIKKYPGHPRNGG